MAQPYERLLHHAVQHHTVSLLTQEGKLAQGSCVAADTVIEGGKESTT